VPYFKEIAMNDSCTICLDNFEEGHIECELQCGHVYHPHCISDWLKKNYFCPLCRRPFCF
ncbi:hypothetical protein HELRODRAFT_153096, partial [Helobdella robusta]|uniref:RING-type domain-containing protein n=1 Tax=Helobdella robusta TaxID=6412 RepID=T1EKZ6_HELRO